MYKIIAGENVFDNCVTCEIVSQNFMHVIINL